MRKSNTRKAVSNTEGLVATDELFLAKHTVAASINVSSRHAGTTESTQEVTK